jgi:hypothetical protein
VTLGPKGGLVGIDGREVILVALVAICNDGFECTNEPWRLQMAFGTWCGGRTKCGLAACCVGVDCTGTGSMVGATTGGTNGLLAEPRELSWD